MVVDRVEERIEWVGLVAVAAGIEVAELGVEEDIAEMVDLGGSEKPVGFEDAEGIEERAAGSAEVGTGVALIEAATAARDFAKVVVSSEVADMAAEAERLLDTFAVAA